MRLKSILYKEIYDSINDGYTIFITGCARGVDMWAAQTVIEFRRKNPSVKLVCAKPYPEYGEKFSGIDRWNYNTIIEQADEIVDVSPEFNKKCMETRNKYMVDRSQKLIAVVSNRISGTGQTINYAHKNGIEVRIIDFSDELNCGIFYEKP